MQSATEENTARIQAMIDAGYTGTLGSEFRVVHEVRRMFGRAGVREAHRLIAARNAAGLA